MDLVMPGFGLVFWTTLTFILLLVLLKKYAWKPIVSAIDDRNEKIEESLKLADKAREDMAKLQSDNEKILADARAEKAIMLKEGKEIKDQIIAEAKAGAVIEANKIMDAAKASIDNEKKAAVSDMKKQIAEFSIEISEKILRKELSTDSKHEKLVEDLLKDVNFN